MTFHCPMRPLLLHKKSTLCVVRMQSLCTITRAASWARLTPGYERRFVLSQKSSGHLGAEEMSPCRLVVWVTGSLKRTVRKAYMRGESHIVELQTGTRPCNEKKLFLKMPPHHISDKPSISTGEDDETTGRDRHSDQCPFLSEDFTSSGADGCKGRVYQRIQRTRCAA